MNEISLLMHMLSRQNTMFQKGATREEILKQLGSTDKNKNVYFQTLITNLADYIKPIGLQIRYNPLDDHWFLSYSQEISDFISANPFEDKPKLAATLYCVLACCLKNFGIAHIHQIVKLRKKKTVLDDLKELEKFGFVEIAKDQQQIKLTPLIGYQLDLEKLFVKLALKLNKKKIKKELG
ncbi:MAG: hypothetical protein ACTSR8_20120 [Promethearchaeota archaeon]